MRASDKRFVEAKPETSEGRDSAMLSTIHRVSLILIAAAMMAASPAAVARPQDAQETLRAENQRLRSALEAARARIAELERRLAAALAPSGTGGATPPPEVPTTVDESVPDASPRALRRALEAGYEERTKDLEIGSARDAKRRVYLQEVRRWAAQVNQRFRSSIDWHVRVSEIEATSRGFLMLAQAVDPVTHAELGDPFELLVPRAKAWSVERLARTRDLDVLQLRGAVIPMVSVNTDRQTAGPFDNPPLLGPFAEFRFRIEPSALKVPAPPEKEEPAGKADS
jgi:hypothetical protein